MSISTRSSDSRQLDVLTVGHALVDVLSPVEDSFLQTEGLVKGSMNLIDEPQAVQLYSHMSAASETSGGSAANTAVGVVACGGTAGFVGVVGDDELGEIFAHDIQAAGVHYDVPLVTGEQTGRSLILITPDGERTMNTNLAVSGHVAMSDLKRSLLESAAVTYVEGYMFDDSHPFEQWLTAIDTIHNAGNRFSITLSDSFCVERHRDLFMHLLEGSVDICFGNADEVMALFETSDLDSAINELEKRCEVAAVTLGAKGSVICTGGRHVNIEAERVNLVDSTGAGDLYAAGVLTGLVQGQTPERYGRLGSRAAAAVVSRMGARVTHLD
jgi:sugar/nucleoside kinase (ribokinase family)